MRSSHSPTNAILNLWCILLFYPGTRLTTLSLRLVGSVGAIGITWGDHSHCGCTEQPGLQLRFLSQTFWPLSHPAQHQLSASHSDSQFWESYLFNALFLVPNLYSFVKFDSTETTFGMTLLSAYIIKREYFTPDFWHQMDRITIS